MVCHETPMADQRLVSVRTGDHPGRFDRAPPRVSHLDHGLPLRGHLLCTLEPVVQRRNGRFLRTFVPADARGRVGLRLSGGYTLSRR